MGRSGFMSTSRVKVFRVDRGVRPGLMMFCFCLMVCRSGHGRIIGVFNRTVVDCRIEVRKSLVEVRGPQSVRAGQQFMLGYG